NEEADILAKEGTQMETTQQLVTFAHLRCKVKARALEDWLERWNSRQNGRKYIGIPTRRVSEPQGSIQKLEAARLTQLRTGHGYFNSYLARIPTSNVESTACPCCYEVNTDPHTFGLRQIFSKTR